ncbi:hypothetical protein TNCV_2842351 [Trichonephila clavipes]|nr:hypothetical protein TNCV_2842351 [Trichonephila clavipes]
MTIENKVLLYTAVLWPILSYGCPVWGYAAKTARGPLETDLVILNQAQVTGMTPEMVHRSPNLPTTSMVGLQRYLARTHGTNPLP